MPAVQLDGTPILVILENEMPILHQPFSCDASTREERQARQVAAIYYNSMMIELMPFESEQTDWRSFPAQSLHASYNCHGISAQQVLC